MGWKVIATATSIEDGGSLPRWYAPAWRDVRTDNWVCYPIGLHKAVGAWRRAWHWLIMASHPSVLDMAREAGRTQGFAQGFRAGRYHHALWYGLRRWRRDRDAAQHRQERT